MESENNHSNDFWDKYFNTITAYTHDRTVAIIGMKEGNPRENGSGICIKYEDRYFIATAAHVLAPYKLNEIILVHTPEPKKQTKEFPLLNYGWEGGGKKDALDIGWIEISGKIVELLGKQFLTVDDVKPGVNFVESQYVMLHGFPTVLKEMEIFSKQSGFLKLNAVTYISSTISTETIDKDPSIDLAMSYPKTVSFNNKTQINSEVDGFSGGGMWLTDMGEDKIWVPSKHCKLIGIQYAWKKNQYVVGNQIQHLLDELKKWIKKNPYPTGA